MVCESTVKKAMSPNFKFLKDLDPALVKPAAMAERYCLTDPCTSLSKLRLFAEFLAKNIAARLGIYTGEHYQQAEVLRELKYQGYLDANLAEMFHSIRKVGNKAVHQGEGTTRQALQHLRFAHQLSVHFFRVFKDQSFRSGPFRIPPNPEHATADLKGSLDEARNQILQLQGQVKDGEKLTQEEIEKRKQAEAESAKAWQELDEALELARQTEEQARQEVALYEEELQRIQQQGSEQTEKDVQQTIADAKEAANRVELTEADTRKLIDRQLSDAGWEADTTELRFSKGVRPEVGKNKAIAEWPTNSGPADYVLFVGLKAVAIVEAKKQTRDVSGAIDQAKRYSRDFKTHDACERVGGPWDGHLLPFVFSTNGRPYLRQMETQSGIWFCDLRRSQNLRNPLESWYTPAGLLRRNRVNVDQAEAKLAEMPFAFDFPIRYYQKNAIVAAEQAIREQKQQALLAMATGTGKTVTCIALIYRLLTAQRFKRILFLVDRSAGRDRVSRTGSQSGLQGHHQR